MGYVPGAEDNELGAWAGARIARALERSASCRRHFSALRGAVALVASDLRVCATLRFDDGHVAIHDGMVGVPDVTFYGRLRALAELSEMGLWAWPRSRALLALLRGETRIYGLVRHPRTVIRVLRLLAEAP
ncbi:MAG: hypothetical protein HY744_25500 [Deltaproteobacteria bacterium]|nr:hypothetical protein [Deltaproteobacteria bacterium]